MSSSNTTSLQNIPQSICVLRLSALGDISHTLPIVRTLQKAWPQSTITWVIGKLEYQLVQDIPGIEFIVFDKQGGLSAYRALRRHFHGRRFDVLLHMQTSLRASFASLMIPAKIRLGFDKQRAKDLQWLFTNHKIADKQRQHVIDSFFGFSEALGISEHDLRWEIPIPAEAEAFAAEKTGEPQRALIISPCSSMPYRNWTAEGYAAVADYASAQYGMRVILCGGPSELEQQYGQRIMALCEHKPVNLIGQTSIKQLLAILRRARLLIAPDSGPAHLATAVGTPVIGLYACTNPDRARPYLSPELVVNKYPESVAIKYQKDIAQLPWGIRVRDDFAMKLISADDVKQKLDRVMSVQ